MLEAPSLRWVHTHSAGADRAISAVAQRGVTVTTSSGPMPGSWRKPRWRVAGAGPASSATDRCAARARWAPLIGSGLPRDLQGQRATIVGWGPIGQQIGAVLRVLGLSVTVVRQRATPAGRVRAVTFEQFDAVLPRTDWLILACPLTDRARVDWSMARRCAAAGRCAARQRGAKWSTKRH
jgi:phosphoglycerate dehydrogenase-like enzyme